MSKLLIKFYLQKTKENQRLEAVQRRAARFKRCYDRTLLNGLNELQWSSLEQHRKEARLVIMYKAVNRKIVLQMPEQVKPKKRITKQNHLPPATKLYLSLIQIQFLCKNDTRTHFLLK